LSSDRDLFDLGFFLFDEVLLQTRGWFAVVLFVLSVRCQMLANVIFCQCPQHPEMMMMMMKTMTMTMTMILIIGVSTL